MLDRSARFRVALVGGIVAALVPGVLSAHQLSGRYESPLPLSAYLLGAGVAVALSFALVLRRAIPPPIAVRGARSILVPRPIRITLRAFGLIAWLWIVVQAIVGGQGEADAGTLFLWIYGWVGLALVSAFIGPAWTWLDPFATLHDLGAAAGRRLGIHGLDPAPYPEQLRIWPAIAGYAIFVWLELVVIASRGGRVLGLVLIVYTLWTLAMMAQYGRDAWRSRGETFSVWFGLLGRLAPLGAADRAGRVAVRRFAAGLANRDWRTDELVLVGIAIAGILFDGLSQTQAYFDLFGAPAIGPATVLLAAWLSLIAGLAVLVGRYVGVAALGAGFVPIAVGYLVAHYLTYILFDGQRILLLVTDPLNDGSDLLHVGSFEPASAWLPPAAAWGIQLLAVVGGHILGAWAGHRAALLEALTETPSAGAPRTAALAGLAVPVRTRELPLAALMVGLTTLTLWSLGQVIVKHAEPAAIVASWPSQSATSAEPGRTGPERERIAGSARLA